MGLMYDENQYNEIAKKSKVGLSVAANVFQYNLLEGLMSFDNIKIYGINSLPVGTWPNQYEELFIFDKYINILGNKFNTTKTINFPGIKQWLRKISARKILEKYIRTHDDITILTYNFYLPYYKALSKLKKKYPRIKIYTIVTDLPNEFGINYEKGIKAKIIDYIGKKSMESTKISDGFVLLTEQMKEPLKLNGRPYAIVEGFANDNFSNVHDNTRKKELSKTIVYTGTLNREFGAGELVKAFQKIQRNDVELHIYGRGNLEDEIIEKSKYDRRIKYLGAVDHETALSAQKNATVLINPRSNDMSFTKYSFPSKTMEYLISGRPLVAYKLDGIPEEYLKYFYVIDETEDDSMLKTLTMALDDTEEKRIKLGREAREFVLNNKSCKKQAEKIIELIK